MQAEIFWLIFRNAQYICVEICALVLALIIACELICYKWQTVSDWLHKVTFIICSWLIAACMVIYFLGFAIYWIFTNLYYFLRGFYE